MASIALSITAKEARSAALGTHIDGEAPGTLRLYTGIQPSAPEDPVGGATLLVEFDVPRPIAASVTNGVLVGAAFTNELAVGSGVATWGRLARSDDTPAMDLTVGVTGSGANVELPTTQIFAGAIIGVTSFQIAEA